MSLQLNTIYNEDCLETMKRMPDNYLHAIVTDPPYGLSFMGKAWDYDVPKVEIWREALRVLKPGGHLLAFAGSRTYHRMAVAIEDAGFEIRDQLIWMYGSGFPKALDISKAIDKMQGNQRDKVRHKARPETSGTMSGSSDTRPWIEKSREKGYHEVAGDVPISEQAKLWQGYKTALKPAHEPCVLARKPIEGTVANNVLKHGTGGLNIDGCRIKGEDWDEKTVLGKYKGNNEGNGSPTNSFGVKEIKCTSPESTLLGRFPANLIHDGSDEVEAVFPQTGGGKMTIGGTPRKTDGFIATGSPDRSEALMNYGDSGSASRYFYTAKASKRERGAGNNHPTVKPLALMKYLVKLVAPPKNGIIYDPFSGSGTTLLACQKLGIDFIGSEISKEYCDIAEERLRH